MHGRYPPLILRHFATFCRRPIHPEFSAHDLQSVERLQELREEESIQYGGLPAPSPLEDHVH